jgi:hypothetical protein
LTFSPLLAAPVLVGSSSSPRNAAAAPIARRGPGVPVAAGGFGAGSAAGVGGGAGGWAGGPGALLFGFFVLALCAGYRFVFAAAGFRPVAFVSLVERPG